MLDSLNKKDEESTTKKHKGKNHKVPKAHLSYILLGSRYFLSLNPEVWEDSARFNDVPMVFEEGSAASPEQLGGGV